MSEEKEQREPLKFAVMNGAMLEAPVWETHERGSNWAAVIGVDPTKPGGLSRTFVERGRGVCLYTVDQVTVFDPMEFAGDYFTYAGSKRMTRWYGVVSEKNTEGLTFIPCKSGIEAILLARSLREARDMGDAARLSELLGLNRNKPVGEQIQS